MLDEKRKVPWTSPLKYDIGRIQPITTGPTGPKGMNMTTQPTIEEVKIVRSQGFGGKAHVEVKVAGQWETLFSYFDDELFFSCREFLGKTREEGERIFFKKDLAYLRS